MWYVVDEFGFQVEHAWSNKESAEESRKSWENTKVAREYNLKYFLEFRED